MAPPTPSRPETKAPTKPSRARSSNRNDARHAARDAEHDRRYLHGSTQYAARSASVSSGIVASAAFSCLERRVARAPPVGLEQQHLVAEISRRLAGEVGHAAWPASPWPAAPWQARTGRRPRGPRSTAAGSTLTGRRRRASARRSTRPCRPRPSCFTCLANGSISGDRRLPAA